MEPLKNRARYSITTSNGRTRDLIPSSYDKTLQSIMERNLIFDMASNKELWYHNFNRYGWINLYDNDQVCKEYLFFTKPDLYIFNATSYTDCRAQQLSPFCLSNPFIRQAAERHPYTLLELQYKIPNPDGVKDPFMHLFTNRCISKMDLSGIAAENNRSTTNIYGTAVDYRSHSLRSDYAFDFAITFRDSSSLEIYTIAKAYDEYMRMLKQGDIQFHSANNNTDDSKSLSYYRQYLFDKIVPEQFSVYKFIVGSDGETILYYAKATGVYMTDVPRADFSDPPNDGFKYSLSFHANFLEDMNPMIIRDFNAISPGSNLASDHLRVVDIDGVNNAPAKYPYIAKVCDIRSRRRHIDYDFRLKWTNARKSIDSSIASTISNATRNIVTRNTTTRDVVMV